MRQENVLSIKVNYIYASFQIFFVIFDQVKNIILEANYGYLGPEATLQYWLLEFSIEDFGMFFVEKNRTCIFFPFSVMRFLFNSLIFCNALRRLPEFSGYKGRRYPGVQGPQKMPIKPRRLYFPPDFQEDWRKIGSKRNNSLTFAVKPITFVKPFNPKLIPAREEDIASVMSWYTCKE